MSKPGSHFQPIRGLTTGSPSLVRPMRRRATRSTRRQPPPSARPIRINAGAGLCRRFLESKRGHQVRGRGPAPPTPSDARPPAGWPASHPVLRLPPPCSAAPTEDHCGGSNAPTQRDHRLHPLRHRPLPPSRRPPSRSRCQESAGFPQADRMAVAGRVSREPLAETPHGPDGPGSGSSPST